MMGLSASDSNSGRLRRALGGLAICLALFNGGLLVAQDAAEENAPAVAAPVAVEAVPAESPEETERRRKLRLAILTGGLIAVTGIAMVVLTILAGSATRRGLRRKPVIAHVPLSEPMPAERFDETVDDGQADERQADSSPASDPGEPRGRAGEPST